MIKASSSTAKPPIGSMPYGGVFEVPFTVVFDNQEARAGWTFKGISRSRKSKGIITRELLVVRTRQQYMKTADYTIDGVPVYIERKAHGDLLGSITHGRRRFKAEHERMREIVASGGRCCVIVESSIDRYLAELEQGSGMNPESFLGSVASWPCRYGIPWYFAGDRVSAEKLALRYLMQAWDHYNNLV